MAAQLKAEFISSVADYRKCPNHPNSEFAFIGRSNVGKSSLINMLADSKGLAKTSSTPGKTQTINHFIFEESWYLVDLPGYGYAKSSKSEREKWDKMVKGYLQNREQLTCVFVLVDSRLEPQKSDLEFINSLGESGIPLAIVFTKCDKLTKNQLQSNLSNYKNKLLGWWDELPPTFITSAESKAGKDEMLEFIHKFSK
ncbi:MAG: ribosome biogenesis GTP-binding protein YihA/YsxC [Bacteroidota bacterium]